MDSISEELLERLLDENIDLIIDNAMKNTVTHEDGKLKPSKEWFDED